MDHCLKRLKVIEQEYTSIAQVSTETLVVFFSSATSPPPPESIPHFPHNVYYVDTCVLYKWLLVSQWGMMSHKSIPFLVDYIVKKIHIDPKILKIVQLSEMFLLDTDGPFLRTKNKLHKRESYFWGQM